MMKKILIVIWFGEKQLEMVVFDILYFLIHNRFSIIPVLNLIIFLQLAGIPDSVLDWTREIDSELSNQNINNQAFSRKHWRLLQCQNGKSFLRPFALFFLFNTDYNQGIKITYPGREDRKSVV